MSADEISWEESHKNIFGALNAPQIEAVRHVEGPLLVMAGAGSGKTRVLTYRIANLLAHDIAAWKILAITFTNKAAAEMKSRAEKIIGEPAKKVWISTFHSFCARLLRREIEVTGKYNSNYIIYDAGDSRAVLRACIQELGLDEERFSDAAAKISAAKNSLVDAEKFREKVLTASGGVSNFDKNLVNIYSLYTKKLIENNALDFDDLIMVTVKIFREHPEVLERYQDRFQYILIDEYQDTNVAQYELTRLLAAKYKNICVVGDADQSIYGWRGADMSNILNFVNDYPNTKEVILEQNYRSTKQILSAANGVIKNNSGRVEKNLWTENDAGERVQFIHCMSDRSEASFLAKEINRLINNENFSYRDIAILYRTNAQSRIIEEKFMQAEIPYVIVGGLKFYERKEIKDVLAYLRLIVNPHDNMSLTRIINVPRRGFGPINIARLMEFSAKQGISIFETISDEENLRHVPQLSPRIRQRLREFAAMIIAFGELQKNLGLPEFIDAVLDETGYIAMLKEGEDANKPENISRVENIGAFVNGATDFANSTEDATLDNFLNHVALLSDLDQVDEEESRVSMMTVHSAKGLEFPVVFIVGMEEGLLPHANSINDDEQLEEERRICYVAMTRAQKRLYLTAAEERKNFGKVYEQEISQFVKEIPRECIVGFSERNAGAEIPHSLPSSARRTMSGRNFSLPRGVLVETPKTLTPKMPPRPQIDWKIGDQVKHKKWGIGTVTKCEGGYLTISFADPSVGVKVLKSVAAPVEKI